MDGCKEIEPLTYSVPEVAEILGISVSYAYVLVRNGEIPGVIRLGPKTIRISKNAITGMSNAFSADYMNVDEAAAYLGIGRQLAYNLAKSGDLPGIRRFGNRYRVNRKEIDNVVNGEGENKSRDTLDENAVVL